MLSAVSAPAAVHYDHGLDLGDPDGEQVLHWHLQTPAIPLDTGFVERNSVHVERKTTRKTHAGEQVEKIIELSALPSCKAVTHATFEAFAATTGIREEYPFP
jgi:phosphodiesterase/alkaline phosphatase D-like protein